MKKYLSIIAILALSFVGCQQAKISTLEISESSNRNSETVDVKLKNVINSVGLGLIKSAQNPTFRDFVHEKAKEQFDGDDNVLLKTLQAQQNATGIDLTQDILAGINAYSSKIQGKPTYAVTNSLQDINKGVMAFPYYDRTLYLQIFIPFIDAVDLRQMPIIGLLTDSDTKLQGYELNKEGTVSLIDLTEEIAKKRLVWIISINEVVGNNGEIAGNTINSNKTNGTGKYIQIESVFIKDKKEGWGAGRADISFVAQKVLGCGYAAAAATQALPFIKISNAELNSWQNGFVSGSMNYIAPYGAVLNPGEFQHYLFFEKDASINSNQQSFTFTNALQSYSQNGAYANCNSTLQNSTLFFFSNDSEYGSTNPQFPTAYYQVAAGTNVFNNYKTDNFGGNQFKLSAMLN